MVKTKVNSIKVKSVPGAINERPKEVCLILHTFHPVMRIFQLCGLMYNFPALHDHLLCSRTSEDKLRRKVSGRIPRILYMVFLYVLCLSNMVRQVACVTVYGISTKSGESLILLTMACVSLATTINASCLVVRLSLSLPKFFGRLCFMHSKYDMSAELKKFRKWSTCAQVLIVAAVAVVKISLIALSVTTIFSNETSSVLYILTCPFKSGEFVALDAGLICWSIVTGGFSMLTLCESFAAYAGFCYLSGTLFIKLAKRLEDMSAEFEDQRDSDDKRMDEIIEFHQDVCELVWEGNSAFNHYIPCLYILTIPSICFVSNALLQLSSASDYLTLSLSVEIVMISVLTAAVWTAALVNSKAATAWETLSRLKTKGLSSRQLHLTCFFAAKLNSSAVGVRFFDFFIIDKAHILTLFGILVTYSLLILQFDPSDPSVREMNTTMGTPY